MHFFVSAKKTSIGPEVCLWFNFFLPTKVFDTFELKMAFWLENATGPFFNFWSRAHLEIILPFFGLSYNWAFYRFNTSASSKILGTPAYEISPSGQSIWHSHGKNCQRGHFHGD